VHAGGLGRDEQLVGDLAVAAPGRDQPQYLELPRRESQPVRLGRRGVPVAVRAERDPGPPGEQGDVVTQRPGAETLRELGSTAQPDSAAGPVAGAERLLGGPEQGKCQRIGLTGRLPRLSGLVPGAPLTGPFRFCGESQPVGWLREPLRGQFARLGPQAIAQRRRRFRERNGHA